ncbi:fructosamine kinase family protein [Marilutibacter alkalisoli]|uniref:Fructosamine kinase family protein n=1 Tax=Marilutibacter alkalisoli TaxID=2591633 RepID=A0A514BSV8_9GAMM|nr:fructosamine kinase family protein [Lysobacter alkalisoli]QDH70482.1 fructosamine kinase family protein [Lysobacter alkalisoli]
MDAALRLLDQAGDGLHRAQVHGRPVVLKRRTGAPAGFFAAEAHGLEVLRATGAMRIPDVLALGADGIVLEDLGHGRPTSAQWSAAGAALATLHRTTGAAFGFDADGWCGDSTQDNTRDSDGHRFFAERRLLPQARWARDAGLLAAADIARIESICERLPGRLPTAPPVLVHGDLWSGNLHACADGGLALIDGAAVHHGWAEGDLAMLVLFGGPPELFFDAYQKAAGIGADWRERAPLLNLYHLLNHLNLFGAGYLHQVQAVLKRFA